jgi:Fe-S cluster assembly iron-binding protein IscA
MVTVTQRAKQELKTILVNQDTGPDDGLRLLPSDTDGFELVKDIELSTDRVVEYEGYRVLLVGTEHLEYFDGKTLDCRDTENGAVLKIN